MTTMLGLELTGRRVLVVGGGPVAARRVQALLADAAQVVVVAPQLCEACSTCTGGAWSSGTPARWSERDLDGAWLVHTATGDRGTDAAVVGWAHERADVLRRRGRLDGLGPHPGHDAAGRRAGRRRLHRRPGPAPHRGRPGRARGAPARGPRRPAAPPRRAAAGSCSSAAGPGDVGLLTLAGRRALAEADVVVTDRLGPVAVLDELRAGVEVIDVGKTPGNHPVPQHEIGRILVEQAQRGRIVVRLKGGDPFVYGRGGEEVLACREAGVARRGGPRGEQRVRGAGRRRASR